MKKILFIILHLIMYSGVYSQKKNPVTYFNTEKGLAINGYDPVSYFINVKPEKGNKNISLLNNGIQYNFISQANKELFSKNPKVFEPQYGGWCAYAMGNSAEKVEIDPETFKIINGKLYLFYHSWTNNTLPKWNMDENDLKTKADKNWASILLNK